MATKKENQNEAAASNKEENQEIGTKVRTSETARKQSEGQMVERESSSADLIKQAEAAAVQLSDNEKAAIEVATGEAGGRKYKLADDKTQYSEEGFTLAGDQEKELPADPSDALIARVRSGFIVEV